MRILFSCVPGYGHLIPLLPLARAFRARGHQVAIMVSRAEVSVVSDEDLQVLVAGADTPSVIAEVMRRTGEDVRGECSREAVIEAFTSARIDMSVDDSLAVAKAWGPDLVVHDLMDYVGAFLAAACDVERVCHTFGADVSADFVRAAELRAAADYRARGVRWRRARWVVDICPPDLQVDGWQEPPGWVPMRPEAYRSPSAPQSKTPTPLARKPGILVTFGTMFGDPAVLDPILRALSEHDFSLRVTLGRNQSRADFTVDRKCVSFEEFMPYRELLEGVDAVVAHGGAGSNLGALTHGIPLVLAPQGADQRGQAERVAASGAGICIPRDEFSPHRIAQAANEILRNPGYRAAARRIAGQIGDMPAPDDVAALLAN
ncbi:UDP-glucuronosyltransferase [Mycobacterium triplex]|uniref:UDP-glucuronosyltransferase n=1 Tax=Mycobacterium triplex TaxID=47839 RepID=A0A024JRJ6_9MYCO|nr:UDP-glucuronosyltransferase [Mycobacterium triplex]